ncbi:MAG: SGNH/GDSL hydrolase family protein [Clostridiaceae bacterium]|nr:SGNH/GDSL hydrolase family protein [Clostridiaceae bacterium]
MNINQFLSNPNEKPLDQILADGGFCGIFRTIGCIGDSLSSGEFESFDETGTTGYHDYFEYSWGQYIARATGSKVYNFSRGGMTAKEYWENFAEQNNFWDKDKLCQAYIIALGANDLFGLKQEIGSAADIDLENCENNAPTFAGYYAKIIQRLKSMQPKARFFIMSMPHDENTEQNAIKDKHAAMLYELAQIFDYTYVLDFTQYAPVYDKEFQRNFYLGGHLNAAGYLLTGRMVSSYIDYIVRNNAEDFAQVGFIGTPYHNCNAKW